MIKKYSFALILCIMVITAMGTKAQIATRQYFHYENTRFNYGIDYPSTFAAEPESVNGDGRVFSYKKECSITVWGQWNALNETVAQRYRQALKGRTGVSLKVLRSNYYIVSCILPNGKIFYEKCVLLDAGGDQERFVCATAVYPKKYRKQFDTFIAHIFKKFPTNPVPHQEND